MDVPDIPEFIRVPQVVLSEFEAGNVWEDQVAVFILVIDNEDEFSCEQCNVNADGVCVAVVSCFVYNDVRNLLLAFRQTFHWAGYSFVIFFVDFVAFFNFFVDFCDFVIFLLIL